MNILQIAPINAIPPVHGSDHRTHGLVSAFPQCGSEIVRYTQALKTARYKNFDLRSSVEIAEGYTEVRSLNPLFRLVRLPSSLLSGQSADQNLARTLDYYTPSKLKSQVKSADVIIVERSPMHVIVMNRLVSDNSKSIIYSIHSLNRGEIHQKALDHSTALVSPSKETEESYERRYSIDCQKHIVKNGIHRDTVRDSFHTFKDRQLMRRYGIDDDTTVCLFVGSNFQENAEAANLLAEIANISNQTGNGVHALIVGEVGAAVEISGENITTTGYVDDLESHFDLADIGFNVIRRPDHGVSFKVMDYLARGIPVISSLQGAYGLDVTDRNEMVITDSFQPPELSKLLEEMDTDEILERLSVNGRGYLENNHLWEQKSKEFHEILENL